jgi:hypothetical protein
MTVSGRFAIVPSAGVSAGGYTRARIEKSNKTQDSKRDRRRDDAGDARIGSRDRRRGASRNGTQDDASFWDGPRLRAPFVAQVLGQIAGENVPDARSALASYTHVEPLRLFFDRSV